MKRSIVTLIVAFISFSAFSQAYMDEIVSKSCACMDNIPDNVTDKSELQMKLGLCIIEASLPYKKQLKKDHSINLDDLSHDTGEKLGSLIGVKMIGVCPSFFTKLAGNSEVTEDSEIVEEGDSMISGTITKVEADFFVVYSLKDESGKIQKFYWLTFIDTPHELAGNYSSLVGKTVTIGYQHQEYFDPKLGEYRTFFVIRSIK